MPSPPSTSTNPLKTVSVATALFPSAINRSTALAACGLNPIRAMIALRTSPPVQAEITASNGKTESTASAAKANELLMKSTPVRCRQ
jgi:hypothetical protein